MNTPPRAEMLDIVIVLWGLTAVGMFIVLPTAVIIAGVVVARATRHRNLQDLARDADEAAALAEWMREERTNGHNGEIDTEMPIAVIPAEEWGGWTDKDESDYQGGEAQGVRDDRKTLLDHIAPAHNTNEGGVAP